MSEDPLDVQAVPDLEEAILDGVPQRQELVVVRDAEVQDVEAGKLRILV